MRRFAALLLVHCAAQERTSSAVPVGPPVAGAAPIDDRDGAVDASAPVDLSGLPGEPASCDCGPAPGMPSWQCPDRIHQGGRGPCVKRADGACGWSILACPAPDPSGCDCGPALATPRWRCPDGAHAAELACVRAVDGRCGFAFTPCPATPPKPSPPPVTTRPPPAHPSCDPLPSVSVLKTWTIETICPPGEGPARPPMRKVMDLGDGTFVIEGMPSVGCFRAKYRRCHSK